MKLCVAKWCYRLSLQRLSKEKRLVDHSKLSQAARDLIEAAEIEAQSIFDTGMEDCNALREQAYESGVDPFGIGFSPGRPSLEAARSLANACPIEAAGHLFRSTAVVYWQCVLKPDVATFIASLEPIGKWAAGKFGLAFELPEDAKRNWTVWALRNRAAIADSRQGRPETELVDSPPKAAATRRGYRAEVQQWMVANDIGTAKVAAERLHIGYDLLKSIMSDKGRKRYGDATLTSVLRKIGVLRT